MPGSDTSNLVDLLLVVLWPVSGYLIAAWLRRHGRFGGVPADARDRMQGRPPPYFMSHEWQAEAGLAAEGGPRMFYGCLPLIAGPLLLLCWLLPRGR